MSELNVEIARSLARTLCAISGFKDFHEETINATADDLREWCQGGIINGEEWSPERQAQWLIHEARHTWDKWAGTKQLHALFLSKFQPLAFLGPDRVLEYDEPVIECVKCQDMGTFKNKEGLHVYCDCSQGVHHRDDPDMGEKWLKLLNKTRMAHIIAHQPIPLEPYDPEKMARLSEENKRIVQATIDGARLSLLDPKATKAEKKTAKKVLKLFAPPEEQPKDDSDESRQVHP